MVENLLRNKHMERGRGTQTHTERKREETDRERHTEWGTKGGGDG